MKKADADRATPAALKRKLKRELRHFYAKREDLPRHGEGRHIEIFGCLLAKPKGRIMREADQVYDERVACHRTDQPD